jgi:hypothetical protein
MKGSTSLSLTSACEGIRLRRSLMLNALHDEPEEPKAFVERQEIARPYRIGCPIHECVGPDLEQAGFATVSFYQVAPHPVFVYRGRIGSSGCATANQIGKKIKIAIRARGVPISLADMSVTMTRYRFQAVMTLPVERLVACDELPDAVD